MPDGQARDVQVHVVVGQHEAHALVLHQRMAEGLAAAGVVGGELVHAARGAEPAHAVREARGRQPHLRVAKALADGAQHVGGRHAQAVEAHHAVAAGEAAVECVDLPFDHDLGLVHVGQEHGRRPVFHARHDDREARAGGAGDEPLAPGDHVVVAVAHGHGLHHRRVGAGAGRRLGHAEARAHVAVDERLQPARLLRRRGHHLHQVHVAFVGRVDVERHRTERRVARLLEHDGLVDMRQAQPTVFLRRMRREQAGAACARHQLVAQRLGGAVRILPGVGFERNHLLGDEAARSFLQVELGRGEAEVHGGTLLLSLSGFKDGLKTMRRMVPTRARVSSRERDKPAGFVRSDDAAARPAPNTDTP
ncbi:hypothetical protein D3C87_812050 [compost metagenome]